MTGDQARAARELLGFSRAWLALQAGIPEAAIYSFETTERMPSPMFRGSPDRVEALRVALTNAGIEFTDDEATGVRLKVATGT